MTIEQPQRRPGRPRNEDADREIIAATLRLLAEQGYERTSIEAVATMADVTRATVYRRYPTKPAWSGRGGRLLPGRRRAERS